MVSMITSVVDGSISVLSGLLVAYCHRFDILTQSSRIYFVACTIGTYMDGVGLRVEDGW